MAATNQGSGNLFAEEACGSEEKMAPISPSKREVSPSTDNLKASTESLEDKGLSNEGFDHNDSEEKNTINSKEDEASAKDPPNAQVLNHSQAATSVVKTGHSRGASGASCGANHSRGTSTDGSTIEPYTPSFSDSRRGTYSEAGTLPIGTMTQEGTPIMEENVVSIQTEKSVNGYSEHETEASKGRWDTLHHFARPIMKKHNPLPTDPSRLDRIKYAFSCPPHGTFGKTLTYLLMLILLWGVLVGITGEMALPGGTLFCIIVLVICAQAAGILISKINLPPLLGMLIVGILFRSISPLRVLGATIDSEWSSTFRSMALVVILTRAGLGLDPAALRKLSFVVIRLAFSPCLVETATVAVMSHLLLGFPWQWAFMLGFVLAAVSPAVVVPCLLNLSDQGYGVEKGIPTLVIAAASIDDVIAISGFGISMGVTFSKGSPLMQGLKGPMEFGVGVLYGVIVGFVMWVLPNKKEADSARLKFFVLLVCGLFAVFGSKIVDFGGAGAMGCLCVSFVAGVGWRRSGDPEDLVKVKDHFNSLWTLFQPILFGLIGTEIDVSNLDMNTIGLGLGCLAVGLSFRIATSFFAVMGAGFNVRERLFVALAWLPKATVQAAIGSTALDFARSVDGNDDYISPDEQMGIQILTIAVLVILITAPIGSIAIMLSAPKLLSKKSTDEKSEMAVA